MASGRPKRSWEADGDVNPRGGKLQRRQPPCPVCHESVSVTDKKRNLVQCRRCDLWVHVATCTDLTATDLINKRVTGMFACKGCLLNIEAELDADDGSRQQSQPPSDGVISRILSEVLALRKETFELKKLIPQVEKLREENAELRHFVLKMSLPRNASRAADKWHTPSKQRSRRPVNKHGSPQTARAASVRFPKRALTPRATPSLSHALSRNSDREWKTVNGGKRTQRTLCVEKKREASDGPRLPRSNVRLYNRRVLVVLRDTDVDSEGLFKYLRENTVEADTVIGLKQKHDHYRSFVVECNEMVADRLFDESLWDTGTLVKEYDGAPRHDKISSCFPQRG